jgi:hypothetical protein
MRSYIVCTLLFSAFCSSAQSSQHLTPCYFLTDTGTSAQEISNSAVELSDGTIYVTGSQENGPYGNNDVALLKYDACGNVLWIKYYGDSLANDAYYLNKTSDEKLIVVGQSATSNNGNDAVLYVLDSSGAILMQKTYGDPLEQMAKYVEQTRDKGFVFCGYTSDAYGSNDGYVVKVDSAGNLKWQGVVGTPGIEYSDMVHELPDGNFLLSGDTKQFGGNTDVELTKFDRNGNVIWDKTYGDQLENGCQGVYLLSNGNYLSYGETNVMGSVAFDFFIQMVDTAGNSISRHTFGGTAADALFSLTETSGMDLICTGYSRSYNGFQPYDIVLFRVDTAGNMKWLKNIASPGVDIGYKLIPSMFGDYVITGLFGSNNNDYFLMRTDSAPNTNVGVKSVNYFDAAIYPNPAAGEVFIALEGSQDQPVRIESLAGELISELRLPAGTHRLDVRALPNGAYMLFVGNKQSSMVVKKMFINH